MPNDIIAGRPLEAAEVDGLTDGFASKRGNRVARNAVTSANVAKAARNPVTMRTYADTYGVSLKAPKTVTNQRQSGRCWLFATLNVMRAKIVKRLDVDDFEFSQAFGMFYDKLEKANAFLGYVVETANQPWSSQNVSYLMRYGGPWSDGGEWAFAANLVDKWGAVPKAAMPETACSKNSAQMNTTLARLMRRDAVELRSLVAGGAGEDDIEARRQEMLADVHRVLCSCLGEPPQTFDLELTVGAKAELDETKLTAALPKRDGDDEKPRRILRDLGITPREFVEHYVGFDGDDYVELVSAPATGLAYGHAYGVRLLDTVVGARPMRLLNVEPEAVEDAAIASLEAGIPCYMACDVAQELGRGLDDFPGVLALDTMDRESLFNVELGMSRTEMLDARETCYTHAMTMQGVELGRDGRPRAWRIENSWGKDACKDGYLIMSADWHRLYGGDVAVERRFVPSELLELWDTAPLEMTDPWGVLNAALAMGREH